MLETVKMRLLSWAVLVFLLSAGSSLADVDVNWLTAVVKGMLKEYRIQGQFCLAANIPENQDPNTLDQVLDSYSENEEYINDPSTVYEGTNVVVAKPAGPVHAEPQVLQNLRNLIPNKQGKFLLIYSYLSPCSKCTNNPKFNILGLIKNNVLRNWRDYAFVFTKVFDEPKNGSPPTRKNLVDSLTELGNSGLGLRNIFRCYKPPNLEFQCYSCSSGMSVSDVCVDNNFASTASAASSLPQQVEGGSRSSSSRGGSRSSSSRGGSRSSSSRGGSRSSSSISRKRARYESNSSDGSRSSRNQGL